MNYDFVIGLLATGGFLGSFFTWLWKKEPVAKVVLVDLADWNKKAEEVILAAENLGVPYAQQANFYALKFDRWLEEELGITGDAKRATLDDLMKDFDVLKERVLTGANAQPVDPDGDGQV